MRRFAGLACALALAVFALVGLQPATGAELAKPTGKVILTVSGKIASTNGPAVASFDVAMLQTLPKSEFRTKTIWTEGSHLYTGVPLQDLLASVGASGKTVHAIALNDYAVDIPVSDAVKNGPIVAYAIDGKEIPVRGRGPLWIIYPFDDNGAYRTEVIYSRSIWQLDRLEIRD